MSAQAPSSCPLVAPIHTFNIHLDPADMDFLKNKLGDSQERHKTILLEAGQANPYIPIVTALQRALHDGSASALTKPLQTQLQRERERQMVASIHRKEVIVPSKLSSLLSATSSAGSPVPSTVPSTTLLDVGVSSPVPMLSAQSPQALLTGSAGALSPQL